MVTIKALDELTLADLWREVPLEEEVWSVVRAREQLALKHLLQGALEQELVEQLAASRYRRTEVRRGYRNGCYERDLVTQLGVIAGIRVPRARTRVERRVFRRYQRRHGVVDALPPEAGSSRASPPGGWARCSACSWASPSAPRPSPASRAAWTRRWPASMRRPSPTTCATCSWTG